MSLTRQTASYSTPSDLATPDPLRPPFEIPKAVRSYTQQYANLYWLRLAVLRNKVAKRAKGLWEDMEGVSSPPQHVKRVLDVENGNLCYIIGTVYMDMILKPNVLEDLARENFIAAPVPRRKFCSDTDEVMLEDESGRVRLVGDRMMQAGGGAFVTGTIMAALGAETSTGDFEVLEVCYAGLPPQEPRDEEEGDGEWIAIVSGLEMGGGEVAEDMRVNMLAEWLTGELGGDDDQEEASKVTRLIIAGSALAQPPVSQSTTTVRNLPARLCPFLIPQTKSSPPQKYGYDPSTYSSSPTLAFDSFLSTVLPSLPIDLLPGSTDPVGQTMPQQPIHIAMLPKANEFDPASGRLGMRTNPFWFDAGGAGVGGRKCEFFGNSGQMLDDVFKYLGTESRLEVAEQMMDWCHVAPTCPDTLCASFSLLLVSSFSLANPTPSPSQKGATPSPHSTHSSFRNVPTSTILGINRNSKQKWSKDTMDRK
ncbi:DNA polymerase delta subunit 2, partial [Phenoliferia sp. Uapishka_3]